MLQSLGLNAIESQENKRFTKKWYLQLDSTPTVKTDKTL